MPISFGKYISPFWYNRICEAVLLISVVILVLYALGQLSFGPEAGAAIVPHIPAAIAAVSAAISVVAYVAGRNKAPYWLALATYAVSALAIALLIAMTGGVISPFAALWLLAGIFSGVFGGWVLLAVALVANAYAGYQLLLQGDVLNLDRIVQLLLLAEVPLIVSYVIWRHTKNKTAKPDAAHELAAQLSEVSSKSDIVINAIADGVVSINPGGIIQLINPAAQNLLGWSAKDAVGLDYKSVIRLRDSKGQPIDEDFSPIRQGLLTMKPIDNRDLELATKSGKNVLISLVVSPVGDKTKNGGVIVVLRDITREKEEERQKAEFISTASHEMRTPVAAIEGYLGLAMNPATAVIDDKARAYLQKAHESTQHLGRLFQDLLTVSKADDARLVPHPTVVDIVALTREVVFSLQQKSKDKGLALTFLPGDNDTDGSRHITPMYYIYADQDQVREVLSNLVDNGVKYTRQGNVTVDVKGDAQTITISITDSGIGIPPEDVPHLFQKFYRVDNSQTREIGGTGLGLYIARRLIEANNGHIGVNSTYGKGSTFYIQLPRISHERANAILNSPSQLVPAGTSSPVGTAPAPQGKTPTAAPAEAAAPPPQPAQPPNQA